MSLEYRAVRVAAAVNDTDLVDVTATEALNRYASNAELWFADPDGDKATEYVYGNRVEIEYSTDGGSTWTRRFAGWVADTEPTTRDGSGQFKVDLLGYDFFLRREAVYESYSSQTLEAVLQNLIEEHSPVNWVGGNVSLERNPTITRRFQGERVDECIKWVLSQSADEDFGVNYDFEFFVEERGGRQSPVDIPATAWVDYDIPDRAKHAINEVRLYWGEPSASQGLAIVEDRASQNALAGSLSAPRRVVISQDKTYTDIESEAEAEAKARQILKELSPIQTGTVDTFGRLTMEAGDSFQLTIPEKGIGDNFRAGYITYQWQSGITKVGVAENRGDVTDLLVSMTNDISRIEARDADEAANPKRFVDLRGDLEVTADVTVEVAYSSDTALAPGFAYPADEDAPGFEYNGTNAASYPGIVYDVSGATGATTATCGNARKLTADVIETGNTTNLNGGSIALGSGTGTTAAPRENLDTQIDTFTYTTPSPSTSTATFSRVFSGSVAGLDNKEITEVGLRADNGALQFYSVLDEPVTYSPEADMTVTIAVTWVESNSGGQYAFTSDGLTEIAQGYTDNNADDPYDQLEIRDGTGTAIDSKALTTARPGRREVSLSADWSTSEANGNDIASVALETSGGTELATHDIATLSKTVDFAVDFTWFVAIAGGTTET